MLYPIKVQLAEAFNGVGGSMRQALSGIIKQDCDTF
jgi:hypothetical protein